jgi:AcrR family transcriptional regulator
MREEGYPAVTTRRLASRVGVSNQLVHYYFRTMDDLFVALLRRRSESNLRNLLRALGSEQPLRALWEFNSDPDEVRLIVEFMALMNHRKTIGQESARHANQLRTLETEALGRILAGYGLEPEELPPVCLSILMSLPRLLVMESAFGVSMGHAEMRALVDSYLEPLEKGQLPKMRAPRKRRAPAAPKTVARSAR